MFYGEFEHSIDEKGRITIPARFREEMEQGVVLSKSTERCLTMYPKAAWDTVVEKARALPRYGAEGQFARRWILASAFDAGPDKHGRVTVPKALFEYANLDKQAIIIGQDDYCEIWSPDDWRLFQQQHLDNTETRTSILERIGI